MEIDNEEGSFSYSYCCGDTGGFCTGNHLYESNGLKYELKGDLQVQLRQKIGEDKDIDLEFDDQELKNRLTYDLGNNMAAFGQLDYSFDKKANDPSADDGGKLEEAYLGLLLTILICGLVSRTIPAISSVLRKPTKPLSKMMYLI
ncbi:hypothetical protein [Amphritea balenae]|uniref:hypothetical protein n=1 Tax=Amphritea balenae TaxID=452629 RepID=UPI0019C8D1AC|nr:hypothetical protein [Amphritea balenae]GGK55641.1 hypothetical protein GCM10007941_02260 [Amphritea balenae]